jgi:threonine/homoserine/homoserine lactone efflux protein
MKYLLAIFPSAGILFLFWLAIKGLVEADRRERAAQARYQPPADDDHVGGAGEGEPEVRQRD